MNLKTRFMVRIHEVELRYLLLATHCCAKDSDRNLNPFPPNHATLAENKMDIEDEQIRDVYANFGLAAYWGQCLEVSASNILIGNAMIKGEAVTVADIDALELSNQRKTMGILIKAIRSKVTLPPDADEVIDTALERRNFLTHHYFRQRAVDFMSDRGRQRMVEELRDIQDNLEKANEVANGICASMRSYLGISSDMIKVVYDRLRRGAD